MGIEVEVFGLSGEDFGFRVKKKMKKKRMR